ncbi:RCC1/BLIP-II [Clathrospora elynae]|uniref:RCC1/BLIP-II n=1 Tax=Clathrospora elynae TaxID=706981 RepID=A0A6A5TAV2_9PLEO|nr:RCC1/BLIP-II [Clathrospora elynae]
MPHQLYVFGSNGECQLGIPAAEIVSTPTLVPTPPPLEDVTAIRSGDNHTLFLNKNGSIFGVGDNRKGQLGSWAKLSRVNIFKQVHNGAFSLIAATCESSAYVIPSMDRTQGSVRTDGSGQWGELGRGNDVTSVVYAIFDPAPFIPIASSGRVIDLAAGVWHYVAIVDDGSVYGWGKARLGQLGEELSGKVTVPTKIEGIPFKPAKVVCGKDFTYLVGDPSTGEHTLLGRDKFNIISNMPADVKGWKDIGATWHAIFVLFDGGSLIAWGKENMWQLLPPNLPPLDKIAVGSDHILALTKDRKLISWGWGKHGNCGDLSKIEHEVKNDMVSGFWSEIDIPGQVEMIGAGFCTSFVVVS